MRLTEICCRWKRALPGGHIWRGKYRLYKEVKPQHLHELRLSYEREEKNMFYLRHPYLTFEQSRGHAKALGKHVEAIQRFKSYKTWENHRYMGDRFGFLKVTDRWE